jgi:hypothetical protein
VPLHVTVHVAPDAQVTLDPAPTVTVQSLPDSHCTLADAVALSEQVAWLRQPRFALSAAVTEQSVPEVHCVLHDEPQVPVHDAPPVQLNEQPFVAAVHAPLPLRLQVPAELHEQLVPLHVAGTPDPDPDDPPQATNTPRRKARTKKRCMKKLLCPVIPRWIVSIA